MIIHAFVVGPRVVLLLNLLPKCGVNPKHVAFLCCLFLPHGFVSFHHQQRFGLFHNICLWSTGFGLTRLTMGLMLSIVWWESWLVQRITEVLLAGRDLKQFMYENCVPQCRSVPASTNCLPFTFPSCLSKQTGFCCGAATRLARLNYFRIFLTVPQCTMSQFNCYHKHWELVSVTILEMLRCFFRWRLKSELTSCLSYSQLG